MAQNIPVWSVMDPNRTINSSVFQFAAYFKYAILNRYDPMCRIVNWNFFTRGSNYDSL